MSRLRRKSFTLAAAVSLVLCVATVGQWVRSYHRVDGINYGWDIDPPGSTASINSWTNRGIVVLNMARGDGPPEAEPPTGWGWRSWPKDTSDDFEQNGTLARRLGFGYEEWVTHPPELLGILRSRIGEEPRVITPEPRKPETRRSRYGVPCWFLVTLTAIAPAAWLRPWKRRRLRMAGLCPSCGYDLRATPSRCPECGTLKTGGVQ